MSKSEIKRRSIRRSGLSSCCCCSLTTCLQLYNHNTSSIGSRKMFLRLSLIGRGWLVRQSHLTTLTCICHWLISDLCHKNDWKKNPHIVVRQGCRTWPSLFFSARVPSKHQCLSSSVLLAAGFSIKLASRLAGCSVFSSLGHSDDGRYRASWTPAHVSFRSVSVSSRHFPSLFGFSSVQMAPAGPHVAIFKLWRAAPWQ